MASRADDRTAEDLSRDRSRSPRSLRMERKSSHRKWSSQKRRSPTEEEVPYTAADRLAAQMQNLPLHKLDRSGRPVTCAFVSRYDSESDSSGSEGDWKMYARALRTYLKMTSMEEQAAAADNPDDKCWDI